MPHRLLHLCFTRVGLRVRSLFSLLQPTPVAAATSTAAGSTAECRTKSSKRAAGEGGRVSGEEVEVRGTRGRHPFLTLSFLIPRSPRYPPSRCERPLAAEMAGSRGSIAVERAAGEEEEEEEERKRWEKKGSIDTHRWQRLCLSPSFSGWRGLIPWPLHPLHLGDRRGAMPGAAGGALAHIYLPYQKTSRVSYIRIAPSNGSADRMGTSVSTASPPG